MVLVMPKGPCTTAVLVSMTTKTGNGVGPTLSKKVVADEAPLELATQPEPATQDAAAMLMPGAKRRGRTTHETGVRGKRRAGACGAGGLPRGLARGVQGGVLAGETPPHRR